MKKKENRNVYQKLFNYLKPYTSFIIGTVLFCIIKCVVNILLPVFIQRLTDLVVDVGQNDEVFKIVGLLLIISLIGCIVIFAINYYSAKSVIYIVKDIQKDLVKHFQSLSIVNKEKFNSGDLLARMSDDTETIKSFLLNIPELIYQSAILVSALIVGFVLNWKLMTVVLVVMTIASILNNILTKPIVVHSRNIQKKNGESNNIIVEAIEGIDVVKSFNLQTLFSNKFKKRINELFNDEVKIIKINTLYMPVGILLMIVPIFIVNIYGGYLTYQKEMSVGDFVMYLFIIQYILNALNKIMAIMVSYRTTVGGMERIFALFNVKAENSNEGCSINNDSEYIFKVSNVSFGYTEDIDIVNDISFNIPKNKIIALVGESGSGKSTIMKLLLKYYKVSKGKIEFLGKDLNDISISDLYKNISVIDQDNYLFSTSIKENIKLIKNDASDEEVIEAAKLAYADNFIMALPEEYNTEIGERAVKISGGQKQRICIARAFLKESKIILLDEPTAALDNESQHLVQKAIDDLSKSKSIFIIAHRLNTVVNADKIIVLKEGKILAKGTHNELLNNCEYYKKLFEREINEIH